MEMYLSSNLFMWHSGKSSSIVSEPYHRLTIAVGRFSEKLWNDGKKNAQGAHMCIVFCNMFNKLNIRNESLQPF